MILFSVHLLFLLLPFPLVSTIFCIFMEKLRYIPLAVEQQQRIILFAISRLDAIECGSRLLRMERHSLGIQLGRLKVCALFFEGCRFAEGSFQFGSVLFLLLLQLEKAGFYGCNIFFDRNNTGIVCTISKRRCLGSVSFKEVGIKI